MNIGLTGGIACGKSTVAAMLVRKGSILIDADQIAREVVEPGSPVLEQVVLHFGQDILLPDGSLHRKKLGEIIFGDTSARKHLESLLHPAIRGLMNQRMMQAELAEPDKLVVVDVPLLYESGLQSMYSEVMVVYVPREVQLERLMKRDGISLERATERINAQMPIEQKKEMADTCINNQGSIQDTERQVEQFWLRKGLA